MTLRISGGLFRGRLIKTPKSARTRPTTSMLREAVFNICQEWIQGARFLDLFAGSGAMGIEAISRGATFTTFVENDHIASKCIRQNIELLELESMTQLLCMDAFASLSKLLGPYDLIYIDPPYEKEAESMLDEITRLQILAPGGLVFLEEQFKRTSPAHIPKSFELVDQRRYGISRLLWYRFSV